MVEVIQLSFADENQLRSGETITIYKISEGTMVWPNGRRRGVLTDDLLANRLDRKVRGFTGFTARHSVSLYLDGEYWTMPQGTSFGTYASNAKKRVIEK